MAASCHSTKSLRDSGGCGLVLTAVPRDSRGDCRPCIIAHITSGNFTENKNHQVRKRGHTREHDDCLDEQIKKVQLGLPRLSKSRINRSMLSLIQRLSGTSSRTSCRSRSLATPNSLKSWIGQNVNSPFSNIRAVTFKLCPRSTRMALGKSSGLQLTPVTITP